MITHTNRKGKTYFLKTGTTSSGNPRWYASRDREKGRNAEAMPDGYGFYENVDGQVFVRKPLKTAIRREEFQTVEQALSQLEIDCRVEPGANEFVVYTSNFEVDSLKEICGISPLPSHEIEAYMRRTANFTPMLRFRLVDPLARTFSLERMTFRGANPGWRMIAHSGTLAETVKTFIPYLDDEIRLFELY